MATTTSPKQRRHPADIDRVGAVSPKALLRKKIETKNLQALTHLSVNSLANLFSSSSEEDRLDKDKFSQAMVNHGISLFEDKTLAEGFYHALDADHSGTIDKKELICGLTVLASGDLEHKLKLAFNMFDINQDHFIQPSELSALLRSISKLKYTSDAELDAFVGNFVKATFERYDSNKDEQLSFEEFAEAARSDPEISKLFTLEELHIN